MPGLRFEFKYVCVCVEKKSLYFNCCIKLAGKTMGCFFFYSYEMWMLNLINSELNCTANGDEIEQESDVGPRRNASNAITV